jgi:hypothetical protein
MALLLLIIIKAPAQITAKTLINSENRIAWLQAGKK